MVIEIERDEWRIKLYPENTMDRRTNVVVSFAELIGGCKYYEYVCPEDIIEELKKYEGFYDDIWNLIDIIEKNCENVFAYDSVDEDD